LDSRRVGAFAKAITATVKPGMVVADVGTGTGILARFAVEAGARKVYAIERHREILEFAARANQQLQMDDRIVLLEGDALAIDLPEKVDVIVCELIGSIGNDEGIGAILGALRTRWLKTSGHVIPSRIDVFVCPVDASEAWNSIPGVYDGDVLIPFEQRLPGPDAYYEVLGLTPDHLLAPPAALDSIDFSRVDDLRFTTETSFELQRAGTLSGLAAWFCAQLSPDVVLDTSPWAPCTCWGQALFPFQEQVQASQGESLAVRFAAAPLAGTIRPFYTWQARLVSGGRTQVFLQASNRLATERAEQSVRKRITAHTT
jgi:protein arginine N-methyltransferase 1